MKTFSRIWLGIGLFAIVFGLGFLALAAATRTDVRRNFPVYTIDKTYEDVEKLNIEIAYGTVEIVEGDQFQIRGENLVDEKFETNVENGTWYIKDHRKNKLPLFDHDLPLNGISWSKDNSPRITITLPKDFVADNITLKVHAGEVRANTVRAKRGAFSVGAGTLKVDRLQILEDSKYQVGVGEIIVEQIAAGNVQIVCGVGEVQIDGTITGESEIQCNIGSVALNLQGKREDYSYLIDSSIGDITIGNESVGGFGKNKRIDNNSENILDIQCNIGEVTIDFTEY
jgi:hypothetical protein